MIGNIKLKELSKKSIYWKEYQNATCKGDKCLNSVLKSEENSFKNFSWDDIDTKVLPWRGATFETSNGHYKLCMYLKWWAKKDLRRLFMFLFNTNTIESIDGEPVTIYLYRNPNPPKPPNPDYSREA